MAPSSGLKFVGGHPSLGLSAGLGVLACMAPTHIERVIENTNKQFAQMICLIHHYFFLVIETLNAFRLVGVG
jgi:hypothetical protein